MNRRQNKKTEQKLHLVGGSYKREKEYLRKCHEEHIVECRKYRNRKIVPEDLSILLKLGIFTEDEVKKILTLRKRK